MPTHDDAGRVAPEKQERVAKAQRFKEKLFCSQVEEDISRVSLQDVNGLCAGWAQEARPSC